MNAEQLLYAIGNVQGDFIREASPDRPVKKKNHRPIFVTLGTLAACFALVCLIELPHWGSGGSAAETTKSEEAKTEETTECATESTTGSDGASGGNETAAGAPSITIDGVTYLTSPHLTISKTCPEGFSYTGDIMVDGAAYAYFTNPNIPEWIYTYSECYDNIKQEPYWAYVRWVDEAIRGIDFIRYNDQIYCALIDTYYFTEGKVSDEAKERYGRVDTQYSWRIEAETVDGFAEVGRAAFEGYDLYPQQELGSNVTLNEIWANPDEPEILLARDYWTTSPENHEIRHTGFLVYVLYEP